MEKKKNKFNVLLSGETVHKFDLKGRVVLPSRTRSELKKLGKDFIITKGFEDCLYIYEKNGWAEYIQKNENYLKEKISSPQEAARKIKDLKRLFSRYTYEISADSLGRILIPKTLREALKLKKEIAVVGVVDHLEIWDKDKWFSYVQNAEKKLKEDTIVDF